MGLLHRDTLRAGLTKAERCELIGHSMDRRMMPGLVKSAGLRELRVLAVEEGGKRGVDLVSGEAVDVGVQAAEGAVPGAPTFYFENVEG